MATISVLDTNRLIKKLGCCGDVVELSELRPPTWFIGATLFMLLISGAWTIASLATSPYRTITFIAATITDLSFLFALLSAALGYLNGARPVWKRVMTYSFSAGVIVLMVSVVLFAISMLSPPNLR